MFTYVGYYENPLLMKLSLSWFCFVLFGIHYYSGHNFSENLTLTKILKISLYAEFNLLHNDFSSVFGDSFTTFHPYHKLWTSN